MAKNIRVGIYVRTSTSDKQDPEMQTRELRQFVELKGWEIVSVYEDKGFTGSNSNRPAFNRILADSKSRKIDMIAVWKLDRFSRSLRDLVVTLEDLGEMGVGFVSIKDGLDLSTSQGRLLMGVIAVFAQFERDLIVMRVNSGLEHARQRGQKLGRPLVRDDSAVRTLRASGMSQRKIAKELGISKGSVQNALADWTKNPLKTAIVNP